MLRRIFAVETLKKLSLKSQVRIRLRDLNKICQQLSVTLPMYKSSLKPQIKQNFGNDVETGLAGDYPIYLDVSKTAMKVQYLQNFRENFPQSVFKQLALSSAQKGYKVRFKSSREPTIKEFHAWVFQKI